MQHNYRSLHKNCHDPDELWPTRNNVYVRSRCNNNWCVHLYAYYFEKDVRAHHIVDPFGTTHSWRNVAVFVEGNATARYVAVDITCFGPGPVLWDTFDAADGAVRWHEDTHVKVVYHKKAASNHCIRLAKEDDEEVENSTEAWFFGPLVDYHTGWPSFELRDKLMHVDWNDSRVSLGLRDGNKEAGENFYRTYVDLAKKQIYQIKLNSARDLWEMPGYPGNASASEADESNPGQEFEILY